MEQHAIFMQRCIDLARLGAGSVAPNPMVGAVLVYADRIIGEGYHRQYGQAHAEVNCINAVAEEDKALIPQATLYVSLEPCAHFGKTPPCADLIIEKKIPTVVVGSRDPFAAVNGKGMEKLRAAGVEVITGITEKNCLALNARFFTFHTKQRPYIILKWAQTANGVIGHKNHTRLLISNGLSNRLVHKWRSEEAAVLVGTQTALLDDPALTNRLWKGNHPVRVVIDRQLRLPASLQLFNGFEKTIVLNHLKQEMAKNILYHRYEATGNQTLAVCLALQQLGIQSVLVEGGNRLLQSFIDDDLYDEVRIITNNRLLVEKGISAPVTGCMVLQDTIELQSDTIRFYKPVLQ